MATLNVIYKIGANVQELVAGVNRGANATERLTSTAVKVGAAFGIAFSAQAVIGFGKSLLDTAGNLSDLHDATGVSIQDLQRLGYIGVGVGVDMDEMGRAVGTLSERLAGGDKSAGAAVEHLGLNIDELLASGPKEAFVQIGDAVGRMVDPMQKNAVAADLFGGKLSRSLIPLLGNLREEMARVPENALASDAQIRQADKLGEAWDRLLIKVKAYSFALLGTMGLGHEAAKGDMEATVNELRRLGVTSGKIFDDWAAHLSSQAAETAAQIKAVEKAAMLGPGFVSGMQQGSDAIDKLHDAFQGFNNEVSNRKAEEAFARLRDRLNEIDPGTVTFKIVALTDAVSVLSTEPVFVPLTEAVKVLKTEGVSALTEVGEAFKAIDLELGKIDQRGIPAVFTQQGLGSVGQHVEVALVHIQTFGDKARGALGDVAAILDSIPGKFAEIGAVAARTGAAIMDNLASGDVFGAVVAGVTGVGQVITSLFRDDVQIRVNQTRQAFVDAAGGLDVLNRRAHDAGMTLDRLLDARNPQQYTAAIDELNDALARQSAIAESAGRFGPSRDQLQGMAQDAHDTFDFMLASGQYTADQLGQAFQAFQEALAATGDTAAQAWLKTHDAVEKGSAGVNKVLDDLTQRRDSLAQAIAQEAPEQIMGSIEAGMRGQLAVLDSQIDAQNYKMAQEAQDAADNLEIALGGISPSAVHVPVVWDIPALPGGSVGKTEYGASGGLVRGSRILHFAAGGFAPRGFDTVPAMLSPGEMVLTPEHQRTLTEAINGRTGGTVVSISTKALENEVKALCDVIARQQQDLPRRLARAIVLRSQVA